MSVKHQVVRKRIKDIERKLILNNLVFGVYGKVSVRIEDEGLVAISLIEDSIKEIITESIPIIDLNGNAIAGDCKGSEGWHTHLGIYKNMPSVNAIIEINSSHIMAFASSHTGIPLAFEDLKEVVGGSVEVAVDENARDLNCDDILDIALEKLHAKRAVIIPNTSLIATGVDLEKAFDVAMICERSAKSTLFAKMLGGVKEL